VGSTWLSPRALRLHLCAVLVVSICLVLGWWQLDRALSGNTLSWLYTVEWPFFAGYAVYMWWRLLHETPGEPGTRRKHRVHRDEASREAKEATREAEEELELAEYNRYLAELHEIDRSGRN
jgi:hypothetical protein